MKKLSSILLCGLMLILSACEKDTESANFAPVVTTGSASNIYRMGATLSGSIQLTETNTAKEYGILFSELESMAEHTEYPIKDGTTNFEVLVQGLEPNKTYYYCTYANSGYSIAMSEIKSFTTTESNAPVFSKITLQSKDENSCKVYVDILDEGGSEILISGFILGESGKEDPTTNNNIKIQNVDSQGSRMSVTISGLEPNKSYLVRAYGINASGTGYSNSVNVTTNATVLPKLSNVIPLDSTDVRLMVKSSITNADLGEVTRFGFCYSSEINEPTTNHFVVESFPDDNNEFHATIGNLKPETTYYIRAFAERGKEIGYSKTYKFTTQNISLIEGNEGDVYILAGGLSDYINDTNKYNITKLKISGYLNGDDIRLIRDMSAKGHLVNLDISEATIVTGGGAYNIYDKELFTTNNVIGDYMFESTKLQIISLPNKALLIGEGAFRGCSSLVSINIPDSVSSIEDSAFYYCTALDSIALPDGLISIEYQVFSNSALTSINIPKSVTSIGNCAFENCSSLVYINIPNGVTSIGNHAFFGCI